MRLHIKRPPPPAHRCPHAFPRSSSSEAAVVSSPAPPPGPEQWRRGECSRVQTPPSLSQAAKGVKACKVENSRVVAAAARSDGRSPLYDLQRENSADAIHPPVRLPPSTPVGK